MKDHGSTTPSNTDIHLCNSEIVWMGFKQMLPISIFVAAFGAAFGLAASKAGVSEGMSIMMSAMIFAGASQFAVLDLWGHQLPIATLILTVFAINARHILMGATLYPWLTQLSVKQRYGIMIVASDANWAMSLQAFYRGQSGFGLLFGGGISLWLFWVLGTWIGVYYGSAINNSADYGLDMVMGCFLLAITMGGDKNILILLIWTVVGSVSLLAYWYLPANSHVIVGAIAGGLSGLLGREQSHER